MEDLGDRFPLSDGEVEALDERILETSGRQFQRLKKKIVAATAAKLGLSGAQEEQMLALADGEYRQRVETYRRTVEEEKRRPAPAGHGDAPGSALDDVGILGYRYPLLEESLAQVLDPDQKVALGELREAYTDRITETAAYRDLEVFRAKFNLTDEQKQQIFDLAFEEAAKTPPDLQDAILDAPYDRSDHGGEGPMQVSPPEGLGTKRLASSVVSDLYSELEPGAVTGEMLVERLRGVLLPRVEQKVAPFEEVLTEAQMDRYRALLREELFVPVRAEITIRDQGSGI